MPYLSSRSIILYLFHIYNDEGELGIGYDMIIVQDLMVKLGLTSGFKCQLLAWYNAVVSMKGPSSLTGQHELIKRDMLKLVMCTSEQASTKEATKIIAKSIDRTSANLYL